MNGGSAGRQANHLAGQTSPYLLQHLYNPVDWRPWGEQALEIARGEDKPIFISIGYSACHWCHVMERESFENEAIAAALNRNFVPIKIDREERPDLDEVYMNAVQLMTGQGGWPLNLFLTPDLQPFFGGTYFPPAGGGGRIGFLELLERIAQEWGRSRNEIDRSAAQMTGQLQRIAHGLATSEATHPVGVEESARAVGELTQRFDASWGGFGGAPKFPPDGTLALLLREHRRTGEAEPWTMAERTLDAMARGGMYDHLGGGFARYSVDERWLVPHFEKMLYNQALLVPLYVDAWRMDERDQFRHVAQRTLDFVRNELTDENGGYWSSLDADSEGREGAFYVWDRSEIVEVLGSEDGEAFCSLYDVSDTGNFEGRNILNRLLDDRRRLTMPSRARRLLLERRALRERPGTDDKVLCAWNGLMITAFARAWQAWGRADDYESATTAARFLLERMTRGDRLWASYRRGHAALNAYLDDYAFLARALLDLYESDFDRGWLEASARLARSLVRHFEDSRHGGFFFTSDDHERLLTRNRSLHDGALPAGAGVAIETLLRLAIHLDADDLRQPAIRALRSYRPAVARAPSACASIIHAAGWASQPVTELAILGNADDEATQRLLRTARRAYCPRLAIASAAAGAQQELPLLRHRVPLEGRPTAFLCRDYACRSPTNSPDELAEQLQAATRG